MPGLRMTGPRGTARTSPRRATRSARIVTQDCCWTRLALASIHLALGVDSCGSQASPPGPGLHTLEAPGKECSVTGSIRTGPASPAVEQFLMCVSLRPPPFRAMPTELLDGHTHRTQ